MFVIFVQQKPTKKAYALRDKGRRSGLMVSALLFGLSGPVRALAGDIVLCSSVRHLTLTVPLSTQVYKWVAANLMLWATLRWTGIPSRGSRNTPSGFMPQKPEISVGLMCVLARMQTLPLPL